MSTDLLRELQRLCDHHDATFRLRIDRYGRCDLAFKRPGCKTERVTDRVDGDDCCIAVDRMLAELLTRIGWVHPANPIVREDHAGLFQRMTPRQRRYASELLQCWRDLRTDVLHPAANEPRLAGPRSSLGPAFIAASDPDARIDADGQRTHPAEGAD